MGPVLKRFKVPKYFDQDCLLYALPMKVQFSGKNAYLVQKVSSVKKLPTSHG